MKCKYEGCEKTAVSKGRCKRHMRWETESTTFAKRKDRICLHCGGPIPVAARIDQKFCGLSCKMKWHRRQGSYTDAAVIASRGVCSVDGCGGALHARGLCRKHAKREWKYGKATHLPPLSPLIPKGPCQFEGCAEPSAWKGMCKKHYMVRYIDQNRAQWNINHSARRTLLKEASPPWVNWSLIKAMYQRCAEITAETGIEHHVDHIIPIKGKNVCGLHVPWNLQILPGAENRRKSNSVSP